MNPEESAECHQTLSLWVESGDESTSRGQQVQSVYEMQVNSDIVRSQMIVRHSIGALLAGLIPRPLSVEEWPGNETNCKQAILQKFSLQKWYFPPMCECGLSQKFPPMQYQLCLQLSVGCQPQTATESSKFRSDQPLAGQ